MNRFLASVLLCACAALPVRAEDLGAARAAMRAKDFARARGLYRTAAEAGDAKAMDALGVMCLEGQGGPKDFAEALRWFQKSADLGDSGGLVNMGLLYRRGAGVPRDFGAAMKWYKLAAQKRNPVAFNNIGDLYEHGLGVVQDYVLAYAWYLLASAHTRDPKIHQHMERLEAKMTKEQIAAAQRQAAYADRLMSAGAGVSGSDADRPNYRLPADENDFAVVVGIEKYSGLPPATYAERDALAVRAHLLALGYPPRNVLLMTGAEATKAKLTAALNAWLPNRVSDKSTVFFYYSGHGAPDVASKQAYLVPADGEPEDLADTAVPIKQVYEKLGALKAKRVLVALDSCFSGAGGRSVLPKGARPLVTQVDSGAAALGGGKVVSLSASNGEEISGALDRQGHGAFTYFLLKGLNGAAADAKGRVTVQSLYKYLRPQVADAARLQNRDQTPQLSPPGADLLLR